MLVALLFVTACSGGDPAAPESDASSESAPADGAQSSEATETPSEAAGETFTTGDLEDMILGEDEAPDGMKAGPASMQTAYGSGLVDDNAKAASYGFLMLRSRTFSTPSALKGAKLPKVGELGYYSMSVTASVYENADGASGYFNDPSKPRDDVQDFAREPLDEELGDEARRTTWREKSNFGGTVPYLRLSWRHGNTTLILDGYGVKNSIDEAAVLALAKDITASATSGAPPLDLPEFTGSGEVVREDSFDNPKSGWKAEEYSNASAAYEDGAWVLKSDEGGYSAPASGIKPVAKLADTRVAVEATLDSAKGGVGLLCRQGSKNQYYVASAFTNGSALVGKVTGGKNSSYVALAAVSGVKLSKGSHDLQMDCVGDDLVRVQLQLDGEVLAEGLDTSGTLAAGAPGMYVEALGKAPVAATFDSITVSRP